MLMGAELTLGQGKTYGLLMTQIASVRDRIQVLNQATFHAGYVYAPFRPKRSFESKIRYRFTGRMPALPIDIED